MTDTNREAFEAWANERGYPLDRLPHGHETLPLAYVFLATRDAWEGWQAAMAHEQARTCQWIPHVDIDEYAPTCVNNEFHVDPFSFCPHCGGKVEVIA
jgi:hypothetical protein